MHGSRILIALAAIAALSACSSMKSMVGMDKVPEAVANLEPTRGSTTRGTVRFEQHGDDVMVTAKVSGLKPGQLHGFHVHEKGDCSSGDGMSAGAHYNPTAQPHGNAMSGPHHAGDIPNLQADANGNAEATFHLGGVSLGSGANDLVGKGLIVHAGPDDYTTQPTGNSGARLACAVITKV
ncbi:MAG TPA: superoxide dismutase family protein [Burkholderiaceae bacterium]|jgi:Cu-Zn family superoxide dismutase|nr:superoxide dismutase family protein [Burkholderiaceae bacterium]